MVVLHGMYVWVLEFVTVCVSFLVLLIACFCVIQDGLHLEMVPITD